MKIFPSSSIKKLDAYTIEHEPIASIDLMEQKPSLNVGTSQLLSRYLRDRVITAEMPLP